MLSSDNPLDDFKKREDGTHYRLIVRLSDDFVSKPWGELKGIDGAIRLRVDILHTVAVVYLVRDLVMAHSFKEDTFDTPGRNTDMIFTRQGIERYKQHIERFD